MFETIFSAQRKQKSANSSTNTKRRFRRRSNDKCVSIINGKTYPVQNWSPGGLMVNGDARPFGVNNKVDVIMKFKLHGQVVDVEHKARVVRKTKNNIAFEFMPLTKKIRESFKTVIEDHAAHQFVN